ncbi:MAG: hypothetical protein LBQ73_05760 [Tannerellaceae bacterium]|jgi:hypothetical protein|nr:hypothetical protein [Tannerellaceae bacterium]
MMANKPKIDFTDADVLLIAEGLARDGLDNKHVAQYFDYSEAEFSRKVNSIPQLKQALKRGRKPLEIIVENALYRRAAGLVKVKTQVRKFIEKPCSCGGQDKHCKDCSGTGKIQSDEELVQETITELPPDTGAAALWLKQKKPTIWNQQPTKVDATTNGKDLSRIIQVEVIDKREQVDESTDN